MKHEIKDVGEVFWRNNEIIEVFVEKDQRRKGNGSLLLKIAETEISKTYKNARVCVVQNPMSMDSKEDAFKFYFKNGYNYEASWLRRFIDYNWSNHLIKTFK
jgi:GNAT superfamily N-acetyltransferase